MTKADKLREWALSKVGSPYVMGGTGKPCTPAYRKARAAQYPDSAAGIKKYCPVLSGRQIGCGGCKYSGKKCYDCAQLVRWGCEAAGIVGLNISGATAQWQRGDFAQTGGIGTLPEGKACILYRGNGAKKQHTGIALGDGTVVHAKGTAYGVVHDKISAGKWTDWAIPRGMDEITEGVENVGTDVVAVYRVQGGRLSMRAEANKGAARLDWLPDGALVDALAEPADGWVRVRYLGKTGYAMAQYLVCVEDEPKTPPAAPDAPQTGADVVMVAMPTATAKALLELVEALRGVM